MIPDLVRLASNPAASSVRKSIRAHAKEDAPRRSIRGDSTSWIKFVNEMKARREIIDYALTECAEDSMCTGYMIRPEGLHLHMLPSSDADEAGCRTVSVNGTVYTLRPEGLHLQMMPSIQPGSEENNGSVNIMRPEGLHLQLVPSSETDSSESPQINVNGRTYMLRPEGLHLKMMPAVPTEKSVGYAMRPEGLHLHMLPSSKTDDAECKTISVNGTMFTLRPEGLHLQMNPSMQAGSEENNGSVNAMRPEGLHLQLVPSSETDTSEPPRIVVNGCTYSLRPEGLHLKMMPAVQMEKSDDESPPASPSVSRKNKLRPEGLHFITTMLAESVSEFDEYTDGQDCNKVDRHMGVPSFIEIPGPDATISEMLSTVTRRHSLTATSSPLKASRRGSETASTTSSTVCEMGSISEGSQSANRIRPEGVHFRSSVGRRRSLAF